MKKLHLIQLQGFPIFEQLQLEEALLRADDRNWCVLNDGSPEAIVLGISGIEEEWVNMRKVEEFPIPTIRRFSGGGTVVVDEHTCFVTMICNTDEIGVAPFPKQILEWNSRLYQPFLSPFGFSLSENDYTLHDRKVGGNAQSLTKKRWLHHSTLLWDYLPEKMEYLQTPPKMPFYRNRRSHSEFLTKLKNHIPKHLFFEEMHRSLERDFHVIAMNHEDVASILSRPHRKSTLLLRGNPAVVSSAL